MKKKLMGLCAALPLVLAGCAELEPLGEYRPVVDPGRTNMAQFETDLPVCRNIALQVEADYKKRQEDEMKQNMLAGMLMGAVVGAAAGHNSRYQGDLIAQGAVVGAAAGAASGDYTHDLVKYGPRRIVDRCMRERGHTILSDIGRG